jgi:Nitrogen regulatory protein P-II
MLMPGRREKMPEDRDEEFLIIICESAVVNEVIGRIQSTGVTHYTIHRGATGCGETGRHEGTPVWPGDCTVIYLVVHSAQVEPVVETLTALHSSRQEHTLGLKVFSLPAHELL